MNLVQVRRTFFVLVLATAAGSSCSSYAKKSKQNTQTLKDNSNLSVANASNPNGLGLDHGDSCVIAASNACVIFHADAYQKDIALIKFAHLCAALGGMNGDSAACGAESYHSAGAAAYNGAVGEAKGSFDFLHTLTAPQSDMFAKMFIDQGAKFSDVFLFFVSQLQGPGMAGPNIAP